MPTGPTAANKSGPKLSNTRVSVSRFQREYRLAQSKKNFVRIVVADDVGRRVGVMGVVFRAMEKSSLWEGNGETVEGKG